MLNDAIKVISKKAGELMHNISRDLVYMPFPGLSSVADKLGEFSLAWKDENSDDWIDGDICIQTYTQLLCIEYTYLCTH